MWKSVEYRVNEDRVGIDNEDRFEIIETIRMQVVDNISKIIEDVFYIKRGIEICDLKQDGNICKFDWRGCTALRKNKEENWNSNKHDIQSLINLMSIVKLYETIRRCVIIYNIIYIHWTLTW